MTNANVLIIYTDQQSLWTLSCYGGRLVNTPAIDSLANEGIKFNNFYTSSAVCTPSRGCFLTGRYPHNNGAYKNHVPLNKDETTFAHCLKEWGYDTAYIGKWHLNGGDYPGWITNDEDAMGFTEYDYMFNCGHYKKVTEHMGQKPELSHDIGDEKSYMTDWLTDKAIDYITRERDKPFCLMLSYPDPHQPYNVRPPYDQMYKPQDMTIPMSFEEEKVPDWADIDEYGRQRYFPMDMPQREEELRKIMAQYCGEVKCIDDNVSKLLTSLRENDMLDKTIVIFTTDHGDYMGEHGLLEKNNLYDSVYHLPLIMRWPQRCKKGISIDSYVNVVDFQPTLLSLLGVKNSGKEHGRDVSSLIDGRDMDQCEEIFLHPTDVPRAGILTKQYELAYVGKGWWSKGSHEFKDHILFDRIKDPMQIKNLFHEEEYREVVEELTDKILYHHKKLGTDIKFLPSILKEKYRSLM